MFLLITLSLLFGWSASQLDYVCTNSTIRGDLQITILVNKHYGSLCDMVSPKSVVSPLHNNIRTWSGNRLSGHLGIRVIDVCGNFESANKLVNELVPWRNIYDESQGTEVCTIASSPVSIGLISTIQPISSELTTLLEKTSMPLVIAQDGYSKEDSQDPSSTLALGHSMETSMEMLSKFMVALNWDLLTLVYSDDAIGRVSYELFKKFSMKYYFCIDGVIPVETGEVKEMINTTGVVYLGSEGIGLQMLTQENLPEKIWVTSLNLEGLTLKFPGQVYSVRRAEGDPLTDALVVLGKAIDLAAGEAGCTVGNISACEGVEFRKKLVRNMHTVADKNLTYTIDDAGKVTSNQIPIDPQYEAILYPGEQKVANISFKDGVTPLVESLEKPSLCDVSERNCKKQCGHLNKDYMYIHGEVMIVVSVPVHTGVDEWDCVGFTQTSLFRAEVARFAFNYLKQNNLNKDTDNIGMLVFDSCGDRLKAAGITYDILRGNRDSEICEPDNPNHCFNHSRIAAFVGDFASAVTQQLETVLRYVPMIHLAYGSTSTALNDRDLYPYFLRTTPSDVVQAHFMAELLLKIKKKGNDVSAVIILYSDELYGKTAFEEAKKALGKVKICIHKSMSVKEGEDFTKLVKTLVDDSPDTKFIITFLDPSHLVGLMEAISSNTYKTLWLNRGYSFVLSDTWGDNKEYLKKYGDIVQGSFSFKINVHFKSITLNDELAKHATAPVNDVNPWLSSLEQEVGECKIRGNFLGRHSKSCDVEWDNLTHLTGETFSLHLMKALTIMYSELRLLQSINRVDYLFNPSTIDDRYNSILRVKIADFLEDDGSNRFYEPFTQRTNEGTTYGNGAENFTIFNINKDHEYVQIFETGYDSMSSLGAAMENFQFQANGEFADKISSTSSATHCKLSERNKLDPYLIGLIVAVCIAVLLIGGIVAWQLRKYMRKRKRRREASTSNSTTFQNSELYTDITNYPQLISSEQEENLRRYLANGAGSSQSSSHLYNADPTYHVPLPLNGSTSRVADNSPIKPSIVKRDSNRSSSSSYITTINRKTTPTPPTPAPRGNTMSENRSSTSRSQSSGAMSHPLSEEGKDD
ncbi:uncharacterized protein [Watersipora subatra]|uniref:uncharacterized protein isoform X2 n=1 Tax=Watersipora subatra TaxID=2589382 RepID=UPI00355BF63E